MNAQIREQHRYGERFGLFDRRTPPFGQGRIDERRRSTHQGKDMRARQDAKEAEVMGQAVAVNRSLKRGKVFGMTIILGTARGSYDRRVALIPQDAECFDDGEMVLVLPELIGQIKIALRQLIAGRDGAIHGEIRQSRRQHGEPHNRGSAQRLRKESFTIRAAIFAAEHDLAPAGYLCAKTKFAFPICAEAEQFRKMPVLKVGDPGNSGEGKPPPVKLCALEEYVNLVLAKGLRCSP